MLKIIIAKTYFDKLKGLIGKKNINYGMLFLNVNAIHTFFMLEAIDVIGLNKQMIVCEIYPNVRPGKILYLKKSKHTLEVPLLYSKKIKIGDKIKV